MYILISATFLILISYEKLAHVGLPQIVGLKHILVVLLISFFIIYTRRIVINKKNIYLLIFFVTYIILQVIYYSQLNISFVISLIFTLFPVLVFLLALSLYISEKILLKNIHYFIIVTNLAAAPALIGYIFGYDLRIYTGLYREAGAMSAMMIFSIIFALYLFRKNYLNSKRTLRLCLIPILIIFLAGLKKDLLLIFLLILTIPYDHLENIKQVKKTMRKIKLFSALLFVLIIPKLLDNITDNADYLNNVGLEQHIRLGMYLTSININIDTNGIGSGLGTFGSLGSLIGEFSIDNGIKYELSDIYYKYGINNIAGNSAEKLNNGEAGTLLDTFWPHIFGELGIYGGIIFILILVINLSFKGFKYYPSFVVFSLYFDGLFLILPESPLPIFYALFVSGLLISNEKNTNNNITC